MVKRQVLTSWSNPGSLSKMSWRDALLGLAEHLDAAQAAWNVAGVQTDLNAVIPADSPQPKNCLHMFTHEVPFSRLLLRGERMMLQVEELLRHAAEAAVALERRGQWSPREEVREDEEELVGMAFSRLALLLLQVWRSVSHSLRRLLTPRFSEGRCVVKLPPHDPLARLD